MERSAVCVTVRFCWALGAIAGAVTGVITGCGGAVTTGQSADAGTTDGGTGDVAVVVDGGGIRDAPPPDVVACGIDCAAPPSGCRYMGPVTCNPPSCGTLVCADAGTAVVCGGSSAGSFPTFDRTCAVATDCVVALHQTDCCGNSHALGIRADQQAAFRVAEMTCDRMYPGCGCPAGPSVADDGMSAGAAGTLAVRCTAGMCSTYIQH